MKKVILVISLVLANIFAYSQSKDSVYVIKDYDEMSNKTLVYPNRGIVLTNEEKTMGFKATAFITEQLKFDMLTVVMVGIGNCYENNEIIILFEDGQKITKKSWNKFNCKGDAYFEITDKDLVQLRSKKITKIRVSNGYSFESFTGEVKPKDQEYFMKIIYALDNNKFVLYKK